MIEALQSGAVILELKVILADFNVFGGFVRVPRPQDRFIFGRGSGLFFLSMDIGVNLRSLLELSPLTLPPVGLGRAHRRERADVRIYRRWAWVMAHWLQALAGRHPEKAGDHIGLSLALAAGWLPVSE